MRKKITFLTAALALLTFLAVPMGMWGQAPVGTTLWGETWTRGDANETPSAYGFEGTTVYGGATLTYAQSSTNTKLYDETLAGGESPELLLSKSNQTWTISNIPTGQAIGMALTFKSNKTTFDVSSTTTGITISGSQKSWTIASTSSVTTFNLTIKNTGSSNARIDNIVLSVTTAGGDTPQPTIYTVTYNANGGIGTMTDANSPYNAGATVTVLGNEFTRTDYEFDHWNTAADDSGTSYDEDDTFTINANTTLYAQWTENTTPTPGGITATLNIQTYAAANNWENSVQYTTATVAPVTFTANGGGNTGKYYTNGQDWRFYQNESASITISVAEGYTLVSVKPTYTVSNTGVLKNGNTTVASGTTVNVSGTSATFTVGNSGSATNGQVRFTNIDVVYVSDGSTQTASDLTITNQSTDLTFDLYNNTTAQVINYTTSSTGAITITPAESDYFSYVHDATAKTITVIPTAVTPSAQTVTISQAADADYYAGTATFTVSVANSDPNLPGTQNNPYTVAQAIANTPSSGNVYIQGIVSSFHSTSIVGDGSNYRYYISDDGTTTTELLVYKGTGLNQVAFSNANDLLVGDEVVVYGTLITYQSAPEVASGNYLYSWNRPASINPSITVTPATVNPSATDVEGTLAIAYANLDITDRDDFDVEFYDAEGTALTSGNEPDWIEVLIAEENNEYLVSYTMDANQGAARTAYFKVFALGTNDYVYSNLVTVTQAAPVVDYAFLPFNWAGGTDEDLDALNGVAVDCDANDYAALNAPYRVKFNADGHYILIKTNEQPGVVTVGIKKFGSGNTASLLIQGSSNGEDFTTVQTFSIIGAQNAVFTYITTNAFNTNDRYVRIYFDKNDGSNIGVGPITIAEVAEPETLNYTVNASTWYFIASPTGTAPTNINALGDLYYYDEQDHMWRNKKINANANGFDFYYGKGYLCANKDAAVTLSFTGNLFAGDTYSVPITYHATTSEDDDNSLAGWNLVGNPFNSNAYIGQSYFVIGQEEGKWKVLAGSGAIDPFAGVMVQATKNTNITFSKNQGKSEGNVMLAVLRKEMTRGTSSMIDNAIVSFDEGSQLEKLVFNNELSKLYIPQNGKDYAVVSAQAQGELPVNFKPSTDGEYTITVNPEGVEMNYLHLIDNITGMDIDLLQTPSYTFEATTRDYESRFRLVFGANNENGASGSATFAYFNGSEWQVSNEGEATLQVIDMMGRIVSTETVNGNCNLNLNQNAGVYMLRLINSNGVKTQKVVVR